ncbi:hypothetical protein OM076_42275 [Solirubrobacter ginsenosidimutans]|uniref:Uncharacterized protein n=1 Tax=Solirubrobacter ginsenosidimutans TaxID=490573 RepID=A0A9X3SBF0_9ACTN|nr:hypothetical protein [Solirubrobacter ginsenosidimutans]MDA0166963.1 hypothetical protein [Solirubrobacter ginsenosidimutans]
MSTFPALEAALDEAAHRHYGRRRRPRWRAMVLPAAAIGCVLGALVVLPSPTAGPVEERPAAPPVPETTLALSRALTQAPAIPEFTGREPVIAHADLPAVADGFEDQTPYPPLERDPFDWLSTAPGPTNMASVNFAKDVQGLVEFRAACIWLRYWLAVPEGRQAAAAVLADAPSWPSLRDSPGNWADVPAQLAAGDLAALDAQNRADCSPWRVRQGG